MVIVSWGVASPPTTIGLALHAFPGPLGTRVPGSQNAEFAEVSIEMRAGHNQWLRQPWDISQTRSRTMGRCEHRSNVLKRAPTIRNTCSRVLEHVFRGVQGNARKAKPTVVAALGHPLNTFAFRKPFGTRRWGA